MLREKAEIERRIFAAIAQCHGSVNVVDAITIFGGAMLDVLIDIRDELRKMNTPSVKITDFPGMAEHILESDDPMAVLEEMGLKC